MLGELELLLELGVEDCTDMPGPLLLTGRLMLPSEGVAPTAPAVGRPNVPGAPPVCPVVGMVGPPLTCPKPDAPDCPAEETGEHSQNLKGTLRRQT